MNSKYAVGVQHVGAGPAEKERTSLGTTYGRARLEYRFGLMLYPDSEFPDYLSVDSAS